jgi:glycerol transport system substrate-binding protein
MKSALSKYSLTALGAVVLLLSACGKKEEPVVAAPAAPAAVTAAPAMSGGEAAAKKWIDAEFQPSTLSKDQQTAELKWFMDAAKKLQA